MVERRSDGWVSILRPQAITSLLVRLMNTPFNYGDVGRASSQASKLASCHLDDATVGAVLGTFLLRHAIWKALVFKLVSLLVCLNSSSGIHTQWRYWAIVLRETIYSWAESYHREAPFNTVYPYWTHQLVVFSKTPMRLPSFPFAAFFSLHCALSEPDCVGVNLY
jgi:hypothetical protein